MARTFSPFQYFIYFFLKVNHENDKMIKLDQKQSKKTLSRNNQCMYDLRRPFLNILKLRSSKYMPIL